MEGKKPRPRRKRKPAADPIADAFGPGPEPSPRETAPQPGPPPPRAAPSADPPRGPIPGLACGGERCVFAPATSLVARFAAQLGPRHIRSFSHAATSGIEMMKALRDFLDEEIAIAERAAGKKSGGARYEKISVE